MSRYRRWLIPKGAVFCPSGGAIAKLVLELQKASFLPSAGGVAKRAVAPDDPAKSGEPIPKALDGAWLDDPDRADLALRWSIEPPLHAPLVRVPTPASYGLEIHRADDFVYPSADAIDPLDATCACGEDLSFEWDEDEVIAPFGDAGGIFTECEECSRTFDPAQRSAEIADPFTGKRESVRGGAAYRFGVVVDCASTFAGGGAAPAFEPDLKQLVEAAFNRDFHEVAAIV